MASLAALVPSGTACGTPPLSIVANSAVNSGLSTHLSPSSVDLAHSHHQQLNHHHAPNSGEIPTLTSPLAGSGYYPSYYHHHQSISHHHHHHHESYQAPVEETGAFFPYHHASGHHQSWPSVTTGASPSTELLMNDYSSVAPTTMAPYPEYEYSHRFMVDPHHHAHQQCQIPPTPLTSSANSTSSSMSSSSSASPPRQIHRGFEAGVEHLHQPPNNLSHMAAYSQPGGEFVSTNASQQVENASSLPVTESTSINHLGQNVTVTSKTQQDGTITTVVTTTTSTGRVVRVVKKRNTANKKERRRTQSINNAFAELRECIPNVPSDTKLSKIKTLRLATSYIAYLMDLIGEDSSSASTDAPSTSAEPESTPDAMLAQHSNEMAQQAQSYSNMQPNLNNDNCVGLRVGDLASFNHYNMAQLHSGCRGGKDSDSAYSKSPSLHQSCGSPTTMSPPTTPNGGFDSPTNVGMNSGLMHQLDDPNRPEEDLRIKEESMEMSASGVVGGPMGHPGDSSSSTSPVFSSDFPNNKRVRGRTGWPQQMWAHELKQI